MNTAESIIPSETLDQFSQLVGLGAISVAGYLATHKGLDLQPRVIQKLVETIPGRKVDPDLVVQIAKDLRESRRFTVQAASALGVVTSVATIHQPEAPDSTRMTLTLRSRENSAHLSLKTMIYVAGQDLCNTWGIRPRLTGGLNMAQPIPPTHHLYPPLAAATAFNNLLSVARPREG